MSAEDCVAIGLRALESRRRVVVTGWMNWVGAVLGRVSPQRLATSVSAWMMRPQAAPTRALPPKT